MDSIVPKVWLDSEKDWVVIAKSCVAELIGTLFLVLVGCGSCYNADGDFVRYYFFFNFNFMYENRVAKKKKIMISC